MIEAYVANMEEFIFAEPMILRRENRLERASKPRSTLWSRSSSRNSSRGPDSSRQKRHEQKLLERNTPDSNPQKSSIHASSKKTTS